MFRCKNACSLRIKSYFKIYPMVFQKNWVKVDSPIGRNVNFGLVYLFAWRPPFWHWNAVISPWITQYPWKNRTSISSFYMYFMSALLKEKNFEARVILVVVHQMVPSKLVNNQNIENISDTPLFVSVAEPSKQFSQHHYCIACICQCL